RWQTARDLALELKWIANSSSQTPGSSSLVTAARNRDRMKWILAALVALVLFAGVFVYWRFTSTNPTVTISDIAPPTGTQFNFLVNGPPALSRDGRRVAFAARDKKTGKSSLWVRSLDSSSAQQLPETEEASDPFWSPDSQKIGFFLHYRLTTMEVSGGPAVTLTEAIAYQGGTWSQTGTILFVGAGGIYQVPASGGPAALVVRIDTSKYAFFHTPTFLPDGKHFLYGGANPGSPADIYFASVDGKESRLLLQGSGNAIYTSGFLLFVRGASLVAQPFEPAKGQLTGTARSIAGQVEQIQRGAFLNSFDASQNGVLIYEPASGAGTVTQLAWFDRTGKRFNDIGSPAIHYDLRLSPDARRLASSAGNPKSEIWIDDLQRGVRMRLTFDPQTDNGIPVWSPDGHTMLFSTLRGSKAGVGIFRKPSDGAGVAELVLPSDQPEREAWVTDWSRDGRFLLFSRGGMATNTAADIWVLPLTGEGNLFLFLRAAASAYDAQFSPDGRWVAYTSRESGRPEVYVTSFDASKFLKGGGDITPSGKWQISS